MKTLEPLEGWKNRHTEPLPAEPCRIRILLTSIRQVAGEEEDCNWMPYNPETHTVFPAPDGYLGTAESTKSPETIDGFEVHGWNKWAQNGLGWNVWAQNDYEFVYYQVIE